MLVGLAFALSATAAPASKPQLKAAPKLAEKVLLDIDGQVYPQDGFPESCNDLFKGAKCPLPGYGTYHDRSVQEGDLVHSTATFTGPDGVQLVEDSWEKDGHVQKAVIDNRVLGKKSDIEIKDGKIYYQVTDRDGKVKKTDTDAEPELVVPSTVMSYVRPRFPDLLAGKEVKLKVIVPDRMDSFTFYMKKIREEKSVAGDTIMVLEMKPSSIIVRAFVDKMLFYVRPKTGEMFAFQGKSSLHRKVGDDYKDIISNTSYEYKVNSYAHAPSSVAQTKADPCTFEKNKCEVKAQ